MCNPYPPQSITGALGLGLAEGERKQVFITVLKLDNSSASGPKKQAVSAVRLRSCRLGVLDGVCCVSVHTHVTWSLHPGGWHCPQLLLCPHSGTQHWRESWPWSQFPAKDYQDPSTCWAHSLETSFGITRSSSGWEKTTGWRESEDSAWISWRPRAQDSGVSFLQAPSSHA